jgi:hypothetical protein
VKTVFNLLTALAVLLTSAMALAHPHIWISQQVRLVTKDGKITHFELVWRFDPYSSEDEIPPIDENIDGKISPEETRALAADMLPELQKVGFLTWLNTGGTDFRPPAIPTLNVRIEDPATFTPPEWDRDAGDKKEEKNAGMPMPRNKQVEQHVPPKRATPRNLVYVMRFALPEPSKVLSITTMEPDDFIRFDVDAATLPKGCSLAKHPTYKSEFIAGKPVFADQVMCRLP